MVHPVSDALRVLAETIQRIGQLKEQDPNYPVMEEVHNYLQELQNPEYKEMADDGFVFVTSYAKEFIENAETKYFTPEQAENYFLVKSQEVDAILQRADVEEIYSKIIPLDQDLLEKALLDKEAKVKSFVEGIHDEILLPDPPQAAKDSLEIQKGLELNLEVNKKNAGELQQLFYALTKKFEASSSTHVRASALWLTILVGDLRSLASGKINWSTSINLMASVMNAVRAHAKLQAK